MKKLLILFFTVCSFSIYAQTTKGSFMIGGSGSMSFNKSDAEGSADMKSTGLSVSPEAGYFLFKNFSAGLSFPFSISRSKTKFVSTAEVYEGRSYSIGVAPFVRYYIPVKSFFIITEGSLGWQYSKDSYEFRDQFTGAITGSDEYTYKHKDYSLAAGPAFFLNPHTSVEILVNYRHTDFQEYDQASFYISVGLQIYLPSNKE